MTAAVDHTKLLDQLQAELNRVLEQTGRLFAAVNSGGKGTAAAQATRLKQLVPGSSARFHETLDHLEEELQLAQHVMRRDLALFRERSNPNKTPAKPDKSISDDAAGASASQQETVKSPEITMLDAPPDQPEPTAISTETDNKPANISNTTDEQPGPDVTSNEPANDTDPKNPDSAPPSTKPDENDPDTGPNSNAADLDSLFNDTGSAAADESNAPTTKTTADNPNEDEDENTNINTTTANATATAATTEPATTSNDDFDFGAFGSSFDDAAANNNNTNTGDLAANSNDSGGQAGDNDDMMSLLPGLEQYASIPPTDSNNNNNNAATTTTDVDLDALFGADPTAEGEDGGEPRDTNFDDMFADFAAGEFGDSAGNADESFDFFN